MGKKADAAAEKLRTAERMLDVPVGIFGPFVLDMTSNLEAVLTGRAEILELGQERIVLLCGKMKVGFHGRELDISCYTDEGLKVSGKISSVEFD